MTHRRALPAVLMITVIIHEILPISGALFLYKKEKIAMGSNWYSRCATFAFFVGVIMNLLNLSISIYILTAAVILAVISLIKYFIDYRNADKKKCNSPV